MIFGRILFRQFVATLLTVGIIFATLGAAPSPAQASTPDIIFFRTNFDSFTPGTITTPLIVEVGKVTPQKESVSGTVSIVPSASGQALEVNGTNGTATTLLQWNNYPGAVPISTTSQLNFTVEAVFTADTTRTAGAAFGLFTGTKFFEFFNFGANGLLMRDGRSLGLTYDARSPVFLNATISIDSLGGAVQITLTNTNGRATITAPLDSSFTLATLNQMRFQTLAGSGASTIDRVRIFLGGEHDEEDEPANFKFHDGDVEQDIERVGNVTFCNIKITISNGGGKARGVFLIFSLEELSSLFDLADVSFLEDVGFVSEINAKYIKIGLGQNNVVNRNGKVKVKIKLKAKQNRVDIKINARFGLSFGDSGGSSELEAPAVPISVPASPAPTSPIAPTQPVTPTQSLSSTQQLVVVQRLPISAIDVRFTRTWRDKGGLAVFGLPIMSPITRANGIVVQYFERARLEFHPELRGTRYEVLLGLLGVELGFRTPPVTTVPTRTTELTWYFPATGHLIGQPFRTYWRTHGALDVYGLPITEVIVENGMTVQYFERARLELHPELTGTAYEIQIGHLGIKALQMAGSNP